MIALLTALSVLSSAALPSSVAQSAFILPCANQEKMTIVLYYSTYCPYSHRVLNYLKQKHKTVPMVNVTNNPQAIEELFQVGGKRQVPCLVVNGQPIYESDAIIDWLSKHPEDLGQEPSQSSIETYPNWRFLSRSVPFFLFS